VYKKCPKCGCEDTAESVAINEEVGKGKLMTNAEPTYTPHPPILLVSPNTVLGFSVPCLLKLYGSCWKCGSIYTRSVVKKNVPIDAKGQVKINQRDYFVV